MRVGRRLLVAAALAVSSLGIAAAPALATTCQPEQPCPDCENAVTELVWRKVFGTPDPFECA